VAPDARADGREAELTDTIYALSSGLPPSAIAVVRISGPAADDALGALCKAIPEPRRASLAALHCDGELIDNAIVIRFPGPASVTGEDVVEFHLHGGRAIVAALELALSQVPGLRPALPGEFTRRAFQNGRIDLAEAEGIADLLEAETQSQRRAALALAGGHLSRQINAWQSQLLASSGRLEALLDFSDEADVEAAPLDIDRDLREIEADIAAILARPPAERLREGVRVVIAGPPNSGKSSLFNALAGREAAITSNVAGTTRDVIEAPLAIMGTPLVLMDTAGLRHSAQEVEAIGIEKARALLDAADLVLWLGNVEEAPPGAITVHAKADLGPARAGCDISTSSMTGEGIAALSRMIAEAARKCLPQEGEVALNARHRTALAESAAALRESLTTDDPLLKAEEVRFALRALDRVTGRAGVEDMLDALFSRFCVGK
jgi:tRNA modification GTPase